MKIVKTLGGVVLAATAFTGAQATLTVHTDDFLAGHTNYNGLEGMGDTSSYPGAVPYTEQGITVQYVGTPGLIWTSSQVAPEGQYSWYPNGGSTGYTSISFDQVINAVEFQAGSGWFVEPVSLYYEVLLAGAVIGTGVIGGLSDHPGFDFYGFSGVSFDEIRLQGRTDGGSSFNPLSFEAGAYDAINFGGLLAAVPEPSTWAMMLLGFGAVGFSMRRRRKTVPARVGAQYETRDCHDGYAFG